MGAVKEQEIHHRRSDCRLCHCSTLDVVLPLKQIPVRTPNMGGDAPGGFALDSAWVPLDLYRCTDCGHLQLLDIVDPRVQYTHFQYRTSISLGLPAHFRKMAAELVQLLGLDSSARVLELGSNDGTLLRGFQENGLGVLGIDPALEIAVEATRSGVPTLGAFFHHQSAKDLRRDHGRFELVVANNTLANLDDLDDVLLGLDEVLSEDGVFVVETQDGAAVIRETLVDTIYHEHLSYFLIRPTAAWLERNGMQLFRVERVATKGGSLRLFAQRKGGPRPLDASVERLLWEEAEEGLSRVESFARMQQALAHSVAELGAFVRGVREAGRSVGAYGASVGTVTLLHQFGLANCVDFIADDKPMAESMEGPGYSVPIVRPDHLLREMPGLVVILAHRYRKPILASNRAYIERGGVFAIPLPRFDIVKGPS